MDNELNSAIGKWLAEQREAKGYSQQYVADLLGVTRTAVHYWETGKRTIYAITLMDYCRAIGADPNDLTDRVFHGK